MALMVVEYKVEWRVPRQRGTGTKGRDLITTDRARALRVLAEMRSQGLEANMHSRQVTTWEPEA